MQPDASLTFIRMFQQDAVIIMKKKTGREFFGVTPVKLFRKSFIKNIVIYIYIYKNKYFAPLHFAIWKILIIL